jgi:hypothetical protein
VQLKNCTASPTASHKICGCCYVLTPHFFYLARLLFEIFRDYLFYHSFAVIAYCRAFGTQFFLPIFFSCKARTIVIFYVVATPRIAFVFLPLFFTALL